MSILLLGLIVFLGVHSVRIVAEDWRTRTIASRGVGAWKGMYSALSVVGLGLVVWGYGLARQEPVILWSPPMGMRHAASLLTLVAFVLLTAAYVPRNALRLRLRQELRDRVCAGFADADAFAREFERAVEHMVREGR